MPRLRFIEERELDAEKRALIASAERTGAPLSAREKAALEYAPGA
jgi:hypothetical protein